ncbi:MAG: homoserine O-acetyltransferase [Oligoflexia bacterium]|nr:homoserine O-acetyltransferase [Oligoflexia bacterium]
MKILTAPLLLLATTLALFAPTAADAYDTLVEKKVFNLKTFTTESGKTLRDVRVGYETYGKLNEKKDNAILIAHFFLGKGHAAGKYKAEDRAPGFWDAIIGSGKAIDTDRYFVIASDTLVNINVKDPNTVTTGPASLNPDTGKPYGMSFPIVTIGDFVTVQKALIDSLGITKLKAVMGPSSGSVQALTWAAAYPDQVERVIGVIPGDISCNPYAIEALNLWVSPILMDPKWNNGDYYGREEPIDGIRLAIKQVVFNTYHYDWANKTFGRKWAAPDKDPAASFANKYQIEAWVDGLVGAFEKLYDANSILYHAKAVQLWSLEDQVKKIKAKVLLIPSKKDLLAFRDYSRNTEKALRAAKVPVQVFELDGGTGHFDGIGSITQAEAVIRKFLSSK